MKRLRIAALGWSIHRDRNLLEIANLLGGLFSVILIGLVVENVVFGTVEQRTVRRWGMQSQ